MEIKILSKDYYAKYDLFLLKNKNNLLYSSSKYLLFVEKILSCKSSCLIAVDEHHIVGALPLMYKDGELGRVYNSLPFYGSNGGVISEDDEVKEMLIAKYVEITDDKSVAASNYIENPLSLYSFVNQLDYDEVDSRIGQFTPLTFEKNNDLTVEESLMQSLHYKTRNSIRKAIKSNVTVEVDNNCVEFLQYNHIDGMKKMGGASKPNSFFDNLSIYFQENTDYNIFVAKIEGKVIAAVLVFYFNNTVEYFMPVTVEGYRNFQPASLVIFEAMLDATKRGLEFWNWGGTWESQEGVYSFKNRWNTVNIKYKYYIKINNKEIYKCSKEKLINQYYGFYLVPFQKLIS